MKIRCSICGMMRPDHMIMCAPCSKSMDRHNKTAPGDVFHDMVWAADRARRFAKKAVPR